MVYIYIRILHQVISTLFKLVTVKHMYLKRNEI